MPLLENDVIFAYLNRADPNHGTAERIFRARPTLLARTNTNQIDGKDHNNVVPNFPHSCAQNLIFASPRPLIFSILGLMEGQPTTS